MENAPCCLVPFPAPKLRHPVVLVHGLCGSDWLLAGRRPAGEYFPGVADYLRTGGNRVYTPRVSPTAGVARRALDLKRFLDREVPTGPVHLIGHSMGGLDARYLISQLDMADRVKSLVTVGTPHRGTAFADWGLKRLARFVLPLLRRLGVPYDALFDLTTDGCQQFNLDVPDAPNVRYLSVAGACDRPWLGTEWRIPAGIVGRAEGPNDGVVSVASARWGAHHEVWAGDHLNLVNWPNRRAVKRGQWADRAADYGRLLARVDAA